MCPRSKRVLLIDDNPDLLEAVAQGLHGRGCECVTANNAEDAARRLDGDDRFDVVVIDLALADDAGIDVTRQDEEGGGSVEVIVLATRTQADSRGGLSDATTCMVKPLAPEELVREIAAAANRSVRAESEPEPTETGEAALEVIVGSHPRILELKENVRRLAQLPANVLVLGESGTGKELVARALHLSSPRRDGPFVAVNCGAFSRTLLEDQLFGHARGAFTGATSDKEGIFVAAGGGTVFLDEIAEMDLDLQVKLLRTLQEREVTPLGSNRAVRWHARLVCATNRQLEEAVRAGTFREDLYYRINVLAIRVPPLREHKEDVPALVEQFLREFAARTGQQKQVSDDALRVLLSLEWPGNVRELRNVLEQTCAMSPSPTISRGDLPAEFRDRKETGGFPTLAEVEREHVLRALRVTGGKRVAAARLLGIDRNRLARLIRRLKIDDEFPALDKSRSTSARKRK